MAAPVAAAVVAAAWWLAGWLVAAVLTCGWRGKVLFSLVEDFYTRSWQCYSRVAAHALGGALGASSVLLA